MQAKQSRARKGAVGVWSLRRGREPNAVSARSAPGNCWDQRQTRPHLAGALCFAMSMERRHSGRQVSLQGRCLELCFTERS